MRLPCFLFVLVSLLYCSFAPVGASAERYLLVTADGPGDSVAYDASLNPSGDVPNDAMKSRGVSCTVGGLPASFPSGEIGTGYSGPVITPTSGTSPYSFAVSSGELPPGLSLVDSSGSLAYLDGTPSTQGTYSFTITITDSNTPSCIGSQGYSINIACPTISVSPSTLSDGTAGVDYSATVSASGGAGQYSFSLTSGALPPGLTLSFGTLSGTPSTTGTFNFVITATDSNSCTGTAAYSITVNCDTITLSPSTLSDAMIGAAYSAAITASGGTSTYTYDITSGALPMGLSLLSGTISGTPSATGTFNFVITATDTASCTGTGLYAVTTSCATITLTPDALSPSLGVVFSTQLAATGGLGSHSFSVGSGTLPTGLSLSGGVLSGTPSADGTFDFTIQAQDDAGCTGSQAYTVVINSVFLFPINLADATLDSAYTQTIFANGTAAAPFTFTATGVSSGLTLSSTGVLSGSPSTIGTINNIDVTATSSDGSTASRTYSLTVACATDVSITPNQLDKAVADQAYANPVSTSRGQDLYDFTLAPGSQLPLGLSLSIGLDQWNDDRDWRLHLQHHHSTTKLTMWTNQWSGLAACLSIMGCVAFKLDQCSAR